MSSKSDAAPKSETSRLTQREPSSPGGMLSPSELEALRRRGREIEEFVQKEFFDKKNAN